jgi:hypothetical protein
MFGFVAVAIDVLLLDSVSPHRTGEGMPSTGRSRIAGHVSLRRWCC